MLCEKLFKPKTETMVRTPKLIALPAFVVGMFLANLCFSQTQPARTAPQSVQMNCNEAPILICPNDYYACLGASTLPSNTGYAIAEPGDFFCPQPILTFSDSILATGPCAGSQTIERTWIATDPDKPHLVTVCKQIIEIGDKEAPVFLDCPNDTTLAPNVGCMASVSWIPPFVTDACGNLTMEVSHINGDKFPIGETTVTYKATDACGNASTCSFKITVKGECCDLPPIIICPSDFSGCPGDSVHPKRIGRARAMPGRPNCATPEITWVDDTIPTGGCPGGMIIERTWTARDPHDKSLKATCVQTITLKDEQPPFIFACPQDITVNSDPNCRAVVDWIEPRALDNCDSVILTQTHFPLDTFDLGTTTVTYTATDLCGNSSTCSFDVTVEEACCRTSPIITCPGDYTGCPGSSIDTSVTGSATAMPGSMFCDPPVITYEDSILTTGPCNNQVMILRTWTAQDSNNTGLRSSCSQIIRLLDTTAPVIISCVPDTTVMPNVNCEAVVDFGLPVANDDCGVMSITSSHAPGDTFPIGMTTVTFTVTDSCGNAATCSFVITVTDDCCNEPPIINCPPDYIGCLKSSTDTSLTGVATAQRFHPDCGTPILSFSDDTVATGPCNNQYLIERTWKATDSLNPNLMAFCIQQISLEDKEDPFFWECPNDTTVSTNVGCQAVVTWIPPIAMDKCGLVSVTSTHVPGDTFDIGTTTVTYTAVDACGNDSTCTFTITVDGICCDVPPTINCPADYDACPGTSIDTSFTGVAVAMPGKVGCDEPLVSYADDTISSGPCMGQMEIIRTWTAVDPNNPDLKTSCDQTLTLRDQINPIITFCPSDTSVAPNDSCEAVVNFQMAIAIDNCGAVSVTATHQPGDTFEVGTTTVVFTATDACGNTTTCSFDIEVRDECCNQPPMIDCPADFFDCPGSSIRPDDIGRPVVTKSHPSCNDPVLSYTDFVLSQGPCPGATRINRVWLARDPDDPSLEATCLQIIELKDTLAPVLSSCPSDTTLSPNFDCQAIVTWDFPVVNDNCGIVDTLATHQSGDTFDIGTHTVFYTFTDGCGNQVSCSFDIVVLDDCCNKPPVITCPSDFTGCVNGSTVPAITGNPVVDKGHPSCEEPVVTFRDDTISTGPCTGQLEMMRLWIATDPNNGLADSCLQLIILKDDQDPRLTNCPSDTTIDVGMACDASVNWSLPNASDNCGIPTLTSTHQPGDTFEIGTTTVTYTATDACGNTTTCSFDVTITGMGFALMCPQDTVITNPTTPDGEYVYWTPPSVMQCGGNCPDTLNGFIYMGERNGHRYFCSLYSATWEQAKTDCGAVGGYLAVMDDAGENAFVASKLMGRNAYIGLSDSNTEGTFEWVNGAPLNFTNWAAGQPDNLNGLQDYVEMAPSGLWSDQYAFIRNEFVCEIPCYTIEQIEGPENGAFFDCGTTTIKYAAQDLSGNTDTCQFDVTVDCAGFQEYCALYGFNSYENWIQKVTFAGINNDSGDNNGHGDFTGKCAVTASPSIEEMCVEVGYPGLSRNVFWRVWIDYNKDLDFNDSGEKVFEGYGKDILCGDLSLPDALNVRTRMRVAISYGNWPKACGVITSGEFEDYCIVIEDGTAYLKEETSEFEKTADQSIGLLRKINVFPNPTYDVVTLSSNGEAPLEVAIIDFLGRPAKIFDWNEDKKKVDIDTRTWPSGQYLIKLKYADGSIEVKSFVKTEK